MTKKYKLIKTKQGSDEWLKLRQNGLGGSDIAAAMNISPWKCAIELWQEKTSQQLPEPLDTESVHWGSLLEDVIAKQFAQHHPDLKVTKANSIYQSIERPYMQASLDRKLTTKDHTYGILEIKTTSEYNKSAWESDIPEYYKPQIAHYLSVTGYDFVDVAVLIGGRNYREYHFTRDDLSEWIYHVEVAAETFWNDFVRTHKRPPLVGSAAEREYIFKTNKEIKEDISKDVPNDFDNTIREYLNLKEREKKLKAQITFKSNQIKDLIGKRTGIESNKYIVKWPRRNRATFQKKAFELDYPDLAEEYTTTTIVNSPISIKQKER